MPTVNAFVQAFRILEGLAHRIRADKRIKGVVMPDRTVMVDVRQPGGTKL
jgi:hypothetical protein